MSDIIEVIKDVTTVTIASDGPQGPTGPTGATGATGPAGPTGSSGVISVVAPITNTGTSTSAVIGINSGVANGVATLDSNGKVPQSQIPAVAITNTFVVASQAAMLALTAEEGDVAVRTDQNKTYILTATPSSTLANWQELLTPTDTVTSVDGRIGTVTLTDKYAQLATANTFTGGVQQITTASAATVGLIVRGAASQTADVQQWINSSGVTIATINPSGVVRSATAFASTTSGLTFLAPNFDTSGFGVSIGGAAQKGLIVRGAASQSANLQEWQDSVGTNLAFVDSIGRGRFVTGLFGSLATSIGANIAVATNTAATIGLIVRGAASQTANLQEWQNSAGTVLGSFTTIGAFQGVYFGSTTTSTSYIQTNLASGALGILTAGNANVGLMVRGNSAQTADLQQWQNSAGTVLAKVDASGNAFGTSLRTINQNGTLIESDGGARLTLLKLTATPTSPGPGNARLYFRDGTLPSTLKLVVRAGSTGAETTVLDNIPT